LPEGAGQKWRCQIFLISLIVVDDAHRLR